MSRAQLVRQLAEMDGDDLAIWEEKEQWWANRLQAMAATAQRNADAARKEIKRRKREARA